MSLEARRKTGAAGRKAGRRGEILAALLLMAKGYRILGFRLKTPQGEIDILARRGRVLAVVEVKRRSDLITALDAVTPDQRRRLTRAAEALVSHHPALANAAIRLDLIALAPRQWPRHVPGAWPEG